MKRLWSVNNRIFLKTKRMIIYDWAETRKSLLLSSGPLSEYPMEPLLPSGPLLEYPMEPLLLSGPLS